MKKKLIVVILACLLLTGCGESQLEKDIQEQIIPISEMATIRSYYHNVADAGKPKGEGILHIGEVDRKCWIEYEGYVTIGIDTKEINPKKDIKVKGNKVIVILPKPKILDAGIQKDSYDFNSVFINDDSIINKNTITSDDYNKAIQAAHEEMMKEAEKNNVLFERATKEVEEIIENYIKQYNEISGKKYIIEFKQKK